VSSARIWIFIGLHQSKSNEWIPSSKKYFEKINLNDFLPWGILCIYNALFLGEFLNDAAYRYV
jgi:hypothetical protein